MSKYIDAQKLEKYFLEGNILKYDVIIGSSKHPAILVDHICHVVRNFSREEVDEIVRCEDCVHCELKCGVDYCKRFNRFVDMFDYCSCGKRKEVD